MCTPAPLVKALLHSRLAPVIQNRQPFTPASLVIRVWGGGGGPGAGRGDLTRGPADGSGSTKDSKHTRCTAVYRLPQTFFCQLHHAAARVRLRVPLAAQSG